VNFEFVTANRIVFGPGTVRQVGPLAAGFGHRIFLVAGTSGLSLEPVLELLAAEGLAVVLYSVVGEPTVEVAQDGADILKRSGCDVVIGLGGGSALDTAKAVAALAANPGEITQYLEVVGRGLPLSQPSYPVIAIPTTAGTGAEVTRNAVLAAIDPETPDRKVKVSLRSVTMLPKLALIDPELTVSLPPDITATTGLDALTQLIEPFVSVKRNPLTDGFCREGIRLVAKSLRKAYHAGVNLEAREGMSIAALFGGIALANGKLGAVHGFAAPIGGMFPASHGVICACLLPRVMEANIEATLVSPDNRIIYDRFAEIAQLLTGDSAASPHDGVSWVFSVCQEFKIPNLAYYGIKKGDLPTIARKAALASSMQGNPVKLTEEELVTILEKSL
jgi:alcohol dehydrogenase class IV